MKGETNIFINQVDNQELTLKFERKMTTLVLIRSKYTFNLGNKQNIFCFYYVTVYTVLNVPVHTHYNNYKFRIFVEKLL